MPVESLTFPWFTSTGFTVSWECELTGQVIVECLAQVDGAAILLHIKSPHFEKSVSPSDVPPHIWDENIADENKSVWEIQLE